MFDIGFSEMLLVGLVALVVLGPERLPGAVRTAGLWVGRLKRSFSNIKAEVEREIGADEIRRQLHNERILDLEREMKQSIMPTASNTARSNSPTATSGTTAGASSLESDLPAPAPQPPTAPANSAESVPVSRPDRSPEP